MNNTISRAAIATATAAIVLALVGCSSTSGASLIPESPKAGAATSTPTPTVIPGDTDGDGKVSTWEAEQLAKAQATYTLADGSAVPLPPADQPLPPEVLADITDSLRPLADQMSSTSGSSLVQLDAELSAAIRVEEGKIGRRVIPVNYVPVTDEGDLGWAVGEPAPIRKGGFPTAEEAKAYANEWVNGRLQYVIVAFD
jgi:hypothetical protein